MGHACEILEFDAKRSKTAIQKDCFKWQMYNADLYECGPDGPMMAVKWTSRVFKTQEEAYKYLDSTFGDYDQTAVQYKTKRGKLMWAIACEVHC